MLQRDLFLSEPPCLDVALSLEFLVPKNDTTVYNIRHESDHDGSKEAYGI